MNRNFKNVREKILLTHHGRSNLYGTRVDSIDRTNITLNNIAAAISYGLLGFSGSKKYKSTFQGVTVIWKYDEKDDLFVILTYYNSNKSKNKLNRYNKNFCLA